MTLNNVCTTMSFMSLALNITVSNEVLLREGVAKILCFITKYFILDGEIWNITDICSDISSSIFQI